MLTLLSSESTGHSACSTTPAVPLAAENRETISPLARLVANLHRQAVAPRGYRFTANIDEADRERAMVALRYGGDAADLRLEPLAVDDAGHPTPGLALYMRYDLPEPLTFWMLFHSLGEPVAR